MEVKFFKLLESYGVEGHQTTKKISDMIKEFDEAWDDYSELLSAYEEAEQDEKSEMQSDIDEYEEALREQDETLVHRINEWYKKKDIWAENAKKLAQGRENKKSLANDATYNMPPNNTLFDGQITASNANSFSNTSSNGVQNPVGVVGQEPIVEKKGGDGWLLFGAFALVITLGAVNVLKNR
jgi:DNA phosphorothioation-dependent restriction protein DptG